MSKPSVFIGCSTGALKTGNLVARALERVAYPEVWEHSALPLTYTIFDGLLAKVEQADFGVFVFLPEDVVEVRGERSLAVRDNVVFEFGLFLGSLGQDRTFAIMPRAMAGHLPDDLSGVLLCTYDARHPLPASAVGIACNDIRSGIERLGPWSREPQVRMFNDLAAASDAILTALEESTERRLAVLAATAGAVIPDVLEKKLPPGDLHLTIHLVNPDHPMKAVLPSHWPEASRGSLRMLAHMVRNHERFKVDPWLYDHIPCVHGFMIDRRELFIGYYRWQENQLVGAQAPYWHYHRGPATEDHFVLFESWLSTPTARRVALPPVG